MPSALSCLATGIDSIKKFEPTTGRSIKDLLLCKIYPANHYVSTKDRVQQAIKRIRRELKGRLTELEKEKKLEERNRLEKRTLYDLEFLSEMGTCPGVENYSRHLSGRRAGEPPPTLLEYFPKDFISFIDESHISLPQAGGMYTGDRRRKLTLVEARLAIAFCLRQPTT